MVRITMAILQMREQEVTVFPAYPLPGRRPGEGAHCHLTGLIPRCRDHRCTLSARRALRQLVEVPAPCSSPPLPPSSGRYCDTLSLTSCLSKRVPCYYMGPFLQSRIIFHLQMLNLHTSATSIFYQLVR